MASLTLQLEPEASLASLHPSHEYLGPMPDELDSHSIWILLATASAGI